jgi:hypothetical protein
MTDPEDGTKCGLVYVVNDTQTFSRRSGHIRVNRHHMKKGQ